MAKAADAFRTISEVADEIGIPKHVLRFWEAKFPQVRPMKRGGGRRYYRPEDLDLLKGICQLLHNEGYTIKGVQKILRRDGVEAVKAFATSATSRAAIAAKGSSPLKPAASEPAPVASGKAAKATGRQRGSMSPDVRTAIKSVLEELASMRALLTDNTAVSEPVRLVRGAA